MKHEIGIDREFADAILVGDKTFEVRINDRNYQVGDTVRFIVGGKGATDVHDLTHQLNYQTYAITYVLSGWGLKDGHVAFGIAPASRISPLCWTCLNRSSDIKVIDGLIMCRCEAECNDMINVRSYLVGCEIYEEATDDTKE